ncbi:hypothetical protein C479_14273 [Halovivax asiaticus JCM 14624]|uniref:Uncharacterized protein n=1 Tax=Halovivax asiaticus JCM 14624 TaxID=1227490 RepID=M0BDH4_9EURY|nr:hypothetical protein [Halovivax asiaticus]ELZ08512.1 hypothetical protein C479_14273 [Halovivax asiaticus JCM 14624]
MRFTYDPGQDGPEMASAEAQQQIALQLERIADALEDDDDRLVTDGGTDEASQHDVDTAVEDAETVPWCPSCEAFAVPVADGTCGECGSTVEFKEADP